MSRSTKLSISLTATLVLTTPLFSAPVRDFADDHVVSDSMSSGSAQQNLGIALIGSIEEPEALASFGSPSMSPIHAKPSKPVAPDLSDGSKPGTKATVVVPLPGPAGLALAGLVLIGTIRRR
jgi:hypothetical protein